MWPRTSPRSRAQRASVRSSSTSAVRRAGCRSSPESRSRSRSAASSSIRSSPCPRPALREDPPEELPTVNRRVAELASEILEAVVRRRAVVTVDVRAGDALVVLDDLYDGIARGAAVVPVELHEAD